MTLAFATFAGALRLIYQNIWALVWLSVLWIACSIPLVTLPPATAALYGAVYDLACGRDAKPRAFFAEMRTSFWRAWTLFLVDDALLGGAAFATVFYFGQEGWLQFAAIPLLYLLLFLALLQMYLFPLLAAQSDKSVRTILRNAFVLLIRRPLFTLTLTVVMAIWALICIVLNGPLLLVAVSSSAFLQCLALKAVLPPVAVDEGTSAPAGPATGEDDEAAPPDETV